MEVSQRSIPLFERLGGIALILQLVRFGAAGTVIAASGLATLYLFREFFGLWYLLASSLSFLVTFMVAFSLQKFWTFREKTIHQIPKQASMSIALAIFNFFFNGALVYTFVEVAGFHYLLAQVFTYGVIGTFDFLMYKFVIFKTP